MAQSGKHIAILGTVGVPACYGGFETLAEQLARYHAKTQRSERLTITCSASAFATKPPRFANTDLAYLPLRANGAASVPYDVLSLAQARASGADVALLLGVSGALALPMLAGGKMRIVAHVDGQEWRRAKWSPAARQLLKWCERLAVRHADAVIADSPAIADDLWSRYGRRAEVITYGGDQALHVADAPLPNDLPDDFALAICRIEPENNVEMILQACLSARKPLVFVGNWEASRYGRTLRRGFRQHPHLRLLDPIYEPAPLQALRRRASLYLHGHCAGGTNPSLVEMMHVGCPTLAFDCAFNRLTTFGSATYFTDAHDLSRLLVDGVPEASGQTLQRLAQHHYKWDDIGAQYFDLFDRVCEEPTTLNAESPSICLPRPKAMAPSVSVANGCFDLLRNLHGPITDNRDEFDLAQQPDQHRQ